MGNKPKAHPVVASSASNPSPGRASSSQVAMSTFAAAIVLAFAVGMATVVHVPRLCGWPSICGSLCRRLCSIREPAVHTPAPQHAEIGPGGVGAAPGQDAWAQTTHPGMATAGWNWTQLSMSRASNFPPGGVKRYTAQMVEEKGAMWVWHTTFARSIPAVVEGLAAEYATEIQHWSLDEYRRRWGQNEVVVAISDDRRFNRGVSDEQYGRLIQHPDRVRRTFHEYLDLAQNSVPGEHVAVQQSPSQSFAEFGLPALPPRLEDLVKYTLSSRNFWAATPPKVSVLHYDWTDSVLMQISGSKRFTIIDPARMHTAYPCVAYLSQLKRVGPGKFERTVTERELDNFPLVNLTHPDLARHPLFREASPFTVDLHPGDALILPAYWYHQVDSYAPPDRLNVAVNYWFQGHSLATRLYRTVRENLFINCTEPAPAGRPHICRGSG